MRCLVLVLVLVLSLALAAFARLAGAQDIRRAGTVRLETTSGGRGPVELQQVKDGWSAELVIVNDGKEPLVVSRIGIRGDAADPRVPPKLVARMSEASLPLTIAPSASRKAIVTWTPERPWRHRQLFGHVLVTTSDENTGEAAMGVRGQLPGLLGPLEGHVLSIIIGVPLIAALLGFLARVAGSKSERVPRLLAATALGVQTLVAAYVYRSCIPDLARLDGNDGLQFVEHVVWLRSLPSELYIGVDGIAATSLLVISGLAFLAVVAERTVPRGPAGYHAALLLLEAALVGALVAMDGLLFLLFSAVAVAAAALLLGAWGGSARRAAALRLAITGGSALLLLAIALVAAARHSDATFLVDGTKVTTSFNFHELSRAALGLSGATFLGGALVRVCFILVLLASVLLLAAFPAHGWLSDVLAEAPSATGILVATALPAIGLCALLRIGCSVLPDGMRWGSGVVVALGAVTAAYGALLALGQTDLRRLAAAATTSQAGFVLLGAGSLTPQGLSGAIVLGATRALACGVFLLLAAAIRERAHTSDAARLGGVASHMPGWATALAAAGLAQAGVLGLGGAWGPFLALLGVLSSYAPLAIVAAIALVVIAAAHLAALSRIAFDPLDPAWESSEHLQPFGGRFPDLTKREWFGVAPLVLIVLLLGLWPAPIVGLTTGTVRDLANAVSPPGPDQVAGF